MAISTETPLFTKIHQLTIFKLCAPKLFTNSENNSPNLGAALAPERFNSTPSYAEKNAYFECLYKNSNKKLASAYYVHKML